MRSLALLFTKLAVVIGIFCPGFVMIASVLAPNAPVLAPEVATTGDGPVWTQHPVRVDQASREVIPMRDPFPYRFRAAPDIRVYDGGSFSVPDGIMVLEDIVAPQPRAICTDDRGRRTACGTRARAELRRLLVGKYIECRRSFLAAGVWLANCHIGGRSVSQTMLDKAKVTAVRRVMPPR